MRWVSCPTVLFNLIWVAGKYMFFDLTIEKLPFYIESGTYWGNQRLILIWHSWEIVLLRRVRV